MATANHGDLALDTCRVHHVVVLVLVQFLVSLIRAALVSRAIALPVPPISLLSTLPSLSLSLNPSLYFPISPFHLSLFRYISFCFLCCGRVAAKDFRFNLLNMLHTLQPHVQHKAGAAAGGEGTEKGVLCMQLGLKLEHPMALSGLVALNALI